jgi:hypothetical protein
MVPSAVFAGAQRFQGGGTVGTDTVPALLTPGERVLNLRETKEFNRGGSSAGPRVNNFSFNFPEGTDATSFLESQDQISAATAATIRRAEGRNN